MSIEGRRDSRVQSLRQGRTRSRWTGLLRRRTLPITTRSFLPGGVGNPDTLRMDENAVDFVHQFFEQGKPVGAICHAPWLLDRGGRRSRPDGDVMAVARDRPSQRRRKPRRQGGRRRQRSGHEPQAGRHSRVQQEADRGVRRGPPRGPGCENRVRFLITDERGGYPEPSAVAVAQLVEPLVVVQVVVGSSPISHLRLSPRGRALPGLRGDCHVPTLELARSVGVSSEGLSLAFLPGSDRESGCRGADGRLRRSPAGCRRDTFSAPVWESGSWASPSEIAWLGKLGAWDTRLLRGLQTAARVESTPGLADKLMHRDGRTMVMHARALEPAGSCDSDLTTKVGSAPTVRLAACIRHLPDRLRAPAAIPQRDHARRL